MIDEPRGKKKKKKSDDTSVLNRRPPYDADAEIGVLGSILLKPEVCDEIVMIIRPDDFYDEANRRLFDNLVTMHLTGRKIDVTLLVDQLRTSGDYELIGGAAYLAEIGSKVPNAAHAVYYAKIIRDKATFRSLIDASTEILENAYDETRDSREMLASAEQQIFSSLDDRGGSKVSVLRDVLHDAMDRIDARMKGDHAEGAVDTCFTEFDGMTGGLHNSELIILAARPSMGKTAFAMNIAENVSERATLLCYSLVWKWPRSN